MTEVRKKIQKKTHKIRQSKRKIYESDSIDEKYRKKFNLDLEVSKSRRVFYKIRKLISKINLIIIKSKVFKIINITINQSVNL